MSENVFWATVTAIITTGICVLILGGCHIENLHIQSMAAQGYEKTTIIGYASPVWQKAK